LQADRRSGCLNFPSTATIGRVDNRPTISYYPSKIRIMEEHAPKPNLRFTILFNPSFTTICCANNEANTQFTTSCYRTRLWIREENIGKKHT
jgi:hypothetical protein